MPLLGKKGWFYDKSRKHENEEMEDELIKEKSLMNVLFKDLEKYQNELNKVSLEELSKVLFEELVSTSISTWKILLLPETTKPSIILEYLPILQNRYQLNS